MNFLGHPSLRAVGSTSQRPGEANGPRQWANPKLSEALGPTMSAEVAPDGLNRGNSASPPC
jgi:hypothetical protein